MNLETMYRRPIILISLFGLLCLSTLGCSGSSATVTGKVIYEKDNSPMTKGMVMFVADDGHHAKGDIQGDGTFQLKSAAKEGMQPGKYGVSIIPPDTSAQ